MRVRAGGVDVGGVEVLERAFDLGVDHGADFGRVVHRAERAHQPRAQVAEMDRDVGGVVLVHCCRELDLDQLLALQVARILAHVGAGAQIAQLLGLEGVVGIGLEPTGSSLARHQPADDVGKQPVDSTQLLGAILAIAKSMAISEPGVPITGKAIVARALASRWTEQFEALAGLDAKTWKSAERGEWALGELVVSEHLRREVEGHYTLVGIEPAKVEAANDAADAAPDHEPVFDAIRQVIADMVETFVAGGASEGDATPPDAKLIQMALLSTSVQRTHPVLLAAYEDGRLVRNVVGSKKPAYQSADWYCVEMTKPARDALRRDAEGNYWISETVDEEKAA